MPRDAQEPRRGGLVPVAAVKRLQDPLHLQLFQRVPFRREPQPPPFRRGGDGRDLLRQVLRVDPVPLSHDKETLDRVLQLPDVPRPGVALQPLQGLLAEGHPLRRELGAEIADQQRYVLNPLPQRRELYRNHAQAVVEVLAELPFADPALEVRVGRRHHPEVDLLRRGAAYLLDDPFLQDAQQLGLQLQREVPHLVQEDGPAVGQLELPLLVADGAGEGPLHVPEQLAFQEVPRDGGTVDGDKGSGAARTPRVDGARHQFLAGAGFAGDEDGRLGVGHLAHHREDPLHGAGGPDDALELDPA